MRINVSKIFNIAKKLIVVTPIIVDEISPIFVDKRYLGPRNGGDNEVSSSEDVGKLFGRDR